MKIINFLLRRSLTNLLSNLKPNPTLALVNLIISTFSHPILSLINIL